MDVQSGRSLPKNFRQIGSAEKSTKVYIEDYVYTFMRKLSEEDDISVGALIGNIVVRDGVECVFISGLIKAAGCVFSDDRVVITDNTWAAVFENVKKYFDGMTVCGWFVSSRGSKVCRQAAVSGIYSCGNNDATLLYIRDKDADEDFVYRVSAQGKTQLSGYYIYYERNEQMQEYMVDTNGAKSVDPPPVNIMKRLENSERKKAEGVIGKSAGDVTAASDLPAESKKDNKAMYFAASLLIVSILALCYSVYQRGDRELINIPVFSDITNMFMGSKETVENESESQPDIIIETAEGIISESASVTEGQSEASGEAGEVEGESAEENTVSATIENSEGNITVSEQAAEVTEAPVTEVTVASPQTEAPPETEATVAVNAPAGTSYTVQAGDTLTSICIKAYGKEDPIKIEEIRNLNGLESADYIFVGQVLAMP